jgi:hypothetical protein
LSSETIWQPSQLSDSIVNATGRSQEPVCPSGQSIGSLQAIEVTSSIGSIQIASVMTVGCDEVHAIIPETTASPLRCVTASATSSNRAAITHGDRRAGRGWADEFLARVSSDRTPRAAVTAMARTLIAGEFRRTRAQRGVSLPAMQRVTLILILAVGCTTEVAVDYTEQRDATNNSNVGGTPEETGLTLGSTGSITIAGDVNDGHYDTEDLDYDAYTFTVSAELTGTMALTGAAANAALELFRVSIIDSTSHGVGTAKVGAPGTIHLPSGVYTLEVQAQSPSPITSTYPYTIRLSAP